MKHTTPPLLRNLLFILLAGAGLSFVHNAPAAAHDHPESDLPKEGAARPYMNPPGMSPTGDINQNSQMMPNATRGMDRAQERMSPMGMEHEKATEQAAEHEADAKKAAKAKMKKSRKTPSLE